MVGPRDEAVLSTERLNLGLLGILTQSFLNRGALTENEAQLARASARDLSQIVLVDDDVARQHSRMRSGREAA